MAKWEIKSLFRLPSGQFLPCTLNFRDRLWWKFMPGVVINVKWPRGDIVIHESSPLWDWTIGPPSYTVESADPNEHYRPYMEKHIGKQGWDWNWGMADRDATDNRLTIKVRRKHQQHALLLQLKWG